MQKSSALVLACLVGWPILPMLRADDRADALAVIERAIDAHGGARRLERLHAYRREAHGKQSAGEKEIDFSTVLTLDLPDRFHDDITAQNAGEKLRIVQIVNGDKAWRTIEGMATLAADESEELREEMYLMRIETLLPLRGDEFRLSLLPDASVDGRLAHVIQVAQKGHHLIKLYFDARAGLLIKTAHNVRRGAVPILKEYRLSEYKNFDGVRLPTRLAEYRNDTRVSELTVTQYRFIERPDAALFERPEK